MSITTTSNITERKQAWLALWLFMIFVFVFSFVFNYIEIKYSNSSSYMIAGSMWGPGFAAIICCLLLRRKISTLPWGWGAWKWNHQAYLLPIIYGAIIYLPIWLFGLGGSDFVNADTLQDWSANIIGEGNYSYWAILFNLLMLMSIGVIISASRALGEEIGWRGFMIWEMRKLMPFWAVGILSGLIWAMWHWPVILFSDYNAGEGSFLLQLFFFTMSVLPIGVILAYLTFKSKSLWPAVVLHASHNLYIQKIYTPLTIKGENTHFYIDEFGIMMPVVLWAFALFYLYRGHKDKL
jgi:membrane protease YdiL (CAAX protease family)